MPFADPWTHVYASSMHFCVSRRSKSKTSHVCHFIGMLFIVLNINNIYHLIFGNWNQGVVLLKYTISGNEYTFMKRATQRSIFIQIVLFSTSGIYTLLNDKKQKLLIFATGNYTVRQGPRRRKWKKNLRTQDKIRENVVI